MVWWIVGVITALSYWLVASELPDLPATPLVAAFASTFVGLMLTGGFHEDGLADTADGFWGGWTKDARLEIMKDSRIGTYGVLALVFSILLRWYCLKLIIDQNLLFVAVTVSIILSVAFQSFELFQKYNTLHKNPRL